MKYAISAGHKETLASAKKILEAGGNAFDAAIAAGFSMFITEPCMSSAGAGGFAMVMPKGEEVRMLDFFAQTPIRKRELEKVDFYPVVVNFGNETEEFHVGMASVAVPGIIKGLFEMHTEYGSMPINDLLFPAKELAKNGVLIDDFQDIDLGLLSEIIREDKSMHEVFFDKQGNRIKKGDRLYMPNLYGFLDMLEHEGEQEFYRGEVSRIVHETSKERGGYIQRADFENYQSFWRKPITTEAFSSKIYLPNAPSLGGALLALILQEYSACKNWVKAIVNTRKKYASLDHIQKAVLQILPECGYSHLGGTASTKGTSHFNITDGVGNVVAFSCSIGEGSGYFVPGTDMQMNNMLGESFLLPNGFHSWIENTRLHSMMTPSIITGQQGEFKFAGGSGGAGRIPYMMAQVMSSVMEEGKLLAEAIESPRVYFMNETVHGELGYDLSKVTEYASKKWDYSSMFFGGVHAIYKSENRLQAEGDSRRYGVSLVRTQ